MMGHLSRLLVAAVIGGLAAQSSTLPRIESAESGRASDERCMTLPKGSVDWRAAAESELGEAGVDKPGAERLVPLYIPELRGSTVHVVTPAPLAITGATWLLVHEGGVTAFHPTVLRIDIEYFGDDTAAVARAGPSRFDGRACGKVPPKTGALVAFAFSGAHLGTWSTRAIAFQQADSTIAFRLDKKNFTVSLHHNGSDRVAKTTVLQSGKKRLLMVTWNSTLLSAACTHEFSLFELTASGFRFLKDSNYGCDI
jgi:hypothetical protein